MGVKSLWNLLAPVGRPILLETVEGKAMAIDSSIWIYQFQATMRDKDGRVLINAHVLGFLRRITKLLFYGIKPVFVFDGGAPALKRNTLNERKRKKSGATTSHAKLAEKLLAARLRKEALERTQGTSNREKKRAEDRDKIVYLEDVDPTIPKAPPRRDAADATPTSPSNSPAKKKAKFYDHDPYRLPDVDLKAVVTEATRSAVPDPRLATEEELRTFIEEMRPEDFDVTSSEFRQLPTEIQYEIIGDLRLKSRQTSHARLEKMLRNSRTPMDFSKAQIQGLRQRNTLTQQLLTTTDSIGKAHISIPVRIASERNKEYILVKNESEAGGWILGIRDHGTQEKPIVIDQDDDPSSGDEDMEEVEVDLHQFQSETVLQAIVRRKTDKGLAPLTRPVASGVPKKKTRSAPLFDLDDDDDDNPTYVRVEDSETEDDALSFAIQASLDDAHMKAVDETRTITAKDSFDSIKTRAGSNANNEAFVPGSRLETVLSFANVTLSSSKIVEGTAIFGIAPLLSNITPNDMDAAAEMDISDNGLDDAYTDPDAFRTTAQTSATVNVLEATEPSSNVNLNVEEPVVVDNIVISENPQILNSVDTDSDGDMEEVPPEPIVFSSALHKTPGDNSIDHNQQTLTVTSPTLHLFEPESQTSLVPAQEEANPDGDDEEQIPWSRSPSPTGDVLREETSNQIMDEGWDAAQEMDLHAEEGEFARFMSQVKGKDLEEVRREIDDEIESLNQQRKAAMRDSEDITQQMIAQIMTMLRLFGIPYITAPMEAEAQCAELVSLGLVDGVITDDSDVFLFGAQRVFKNMFNQSKTVECFLLSDLSRELGLDRDTLIRLAYLLGSDYIEGLPGIGPVAAMELLKEFPGMDGLHKFKDWWMKVQSGKDIAEDNKSKFRQRFKKKFKSLYLDRDWPNSTVRDAYYHPTVDSSDERFKWGMPDLDGLRQFFLQELGWQQSKVDELLLPIIQKMNKRGQVAAVNKQSNLTEYFDVSAGMGAFVPKKRQAYTSKRLQDIVTDFRKQQRASSSTFVMEESRRTETDDDDADDYNEGSRKKRKTGQRGQKVKNKKSAAVAGGKRARGKRKSKKAKGNDSEDESPVNSDVNEVRSDTSSAVQLRPRPRPRPTYKSANPVIEGDEYYT